MEWEKQLHQLSDRLSYLKDIFPGKHEEDIALLESRLSAVRQKLETCSQEEAQADMTSLEDLFFFIECKLEDKLTPMDKVRIVRHPQRICLRDILENVYDNYTEIGGQGEHTNDPAMVIARAYITRKRHGKVCHQPVLVIGHEKGHGEEFRNGGSAKPWGNAKAKHYMGVAETEGIPIHAYVFTPGGYPLEDYPGAAQQIARNIYEMAGLTVPLIAIFSEGGSGGAEAISLADKRLMLSHGYYSVISPEGAAAIEGRLRGGARASADLVERCAKDLHLTAEDNLKFGYVDKIIQEPVLGARPYHYEFFRTIRQEVIRATDEVVLAARGLAPLRAATLRRFRDRELNLDEISVRWDLSRKARQRLVERRQNKFIKASHRECQNRRSIMGRLGDAWSEQWWEIYNRLIYDFYHRNRRTFANLLDELGSEWEMVKLRAMKPWNKLRRKPVAENAAAEEELTTLSEWEENDRSGWAWVSDKAREDRAISCPYSAKRGCMDMWAPDLYNEFAGVCSTCGHHFPMEYQWVMNNCFDENSLYEFNTEVEAGNPLSFPGFDEKIAEAKRKTGLKSGCITFEARIDGVQVVVAILVGSFRGGSVGVAEGSKFVAAADRARRKRYPFIVYCHGTAGIRIQEGTHGVIQMPRCTVAVRRYIESGGLYLVLYDTKSYGGPVASFLGCAFYQFAIRSSDIGFAGPGVIKNTTGMDIPPDHHNCYKALSRGHIQGVWDRRDVRANLRQALETMGGRNLYYR
ncbi:carboxyl transferase domain-containing protein [Mailhella massiliensis]|uniref:Acetyl-coenzyme A carboxylase carboxyl transferase subunits beta/alpha n=1 Tax=Mailhella massiliensis TaxID=1903261 RepID=A0A921ATV8_9BACT|nr:carboxyl transferase domain-containing protein [Mailhella massiliensis]HJD96023.1 acetyl-CoA carboxylase carboxyl transferase subunit alpha/beta [Mailhella massiliensis]